MSEQLQAFYDACVANLDERYTLIYISRGDQLSDEQADMVMRGDDEALWESVEEWESDSRYEGAKYAVDEVVKQTIREWEQRDDRDYSELEGEFTSSDLWDEVRFAIEDRDDSNVIRDLARETPVTLCRTAVLDEDQVTYGNDDLTRTEFLVKLGLKRNHHNYEVMGEILAEVNYPGAILMGCLVYAVDPGDVYDFPGDTEYVDVVNPHVWLGNMWAGDGYCAGPVDGTFRIKREDLHTDTGEFGYGWNQVAGVYASGYTAEVRAVPVKKEDAA